jgi:hypothetical protein
LDRIAGAISDLARQPELPLLHVTRVAS